MLSDLIGQEAGTCEVIRGHGNSIKDVGCIAARNRARRRHSLHMVPSHPHR